MITDLHRDPAPPTASVRLASGSRVALRAALPQDTALQRAFFRALSPEARHGRFMMQLNDVSDALAAQLGNVDDCRHVMLLAAIVTDAGETMIGEARYVVDAQDAGACEVAIAVADGWRGTGLARALLRHLVARAACAGLRTMVGHTLAGNAAMIALAARAGFAASVDPGDARLVRLSKDLAGAPVATRRPRRSNVPAFATG